MIPRDKPEHRLGAPMWVHGGPDDVGTWHLDPMAHALDQSAWRDEGVLPDALCPEIGRRILLAQLQSSEWVLRRVEKLDLQAELAVSRIVLLEFVMPHDAPTFVDDAGRRMRLIPITLLRRRTLVGLHIRDERGESLSLPGLRLTQQLDQSLIWAAAATYDPGLLQPPGTSRRSDELRAWIQQATSGKLEDVQRVYAELAAPKKESVLLDLGPDPLFHNAVERLRHAFTLYLLVEDTPARNHRVEISFEEPIDWRYQKPSCEKIEGTSIAEWAYTPGKPTFWSVRGIASTFGLASTRLRLQVPGAEYAASFHVELSSPPGIAIVASTLLAGRPNETARHCSIDQVIGHAPTVGLHAVEVPNGSLSRVQADLRVDPRGWLSTMVAATLAIVALMATVLVHEQKIHGVHDFHSEADKLGITNAILLLATAFAALAALVAQRDSSGMAGRFVSGLRGLITLTLAYPVIAAGILTYGGQQSRIMSAHLSLVVLWTLTVLSSMTFVVTSIAWFESWWRVRRPLIQESPWDMTRFRDDKPPTQPALWRHVKDFIAASDEAGFSKPAVGIGTAESWHQKYAWTDARQIAAVTALEKAPHLGSGAGVFVCGPGTGAARCGTCPMPSRTVV